jgi:hypothetical protein
MGVSFAWSLALLFSFGLASASSSEAAGCFRACGEQVRECSVESRPSLFECREECSSSGTRAEIRDCENECRKMRRLAKQTCRTGRAGCISACKAGLDMGPGPTAGDPPQGPLPTNKPPGSNPANCMGQCGQELGTCAHDTASAGSACIKECKSASDRQACIRECTSTAADGHEECQDDARECRSDCGFPSSTTTTLSVPTTTLPNTEITTTTTLAEETTTTTLAEETTTTTLPEETTTTTLPEQTTTTQPGQTTTTLVDQTTTTTLPEETTTTTQPEQTTTTTTPEITTTTVISSAGACPDVGELVLYAGIGQDCTTNADCPAGTCESDSRCHTVTRLDSGWTGFAHDSDINDGIVTRGFLDCPGPGPVCGECNVTGIDPSTGSCRCANNIRTECDQPFEADADDCGGSVCDCYFGAPFPLSSGGTPACVLNRFSQDISGTANVDLGSGEITANLRAKVFLGASTRSPCNTCGGKCLNNPEVFCNRDEDCPGSTCTLDTNPGDGVRGGFCTSGDPVGQTCDPTGFNSSFPAYVGEQGGGWYSLDCLPDVGKNISGAGLIIGLTQTTGTSELEANVSCGGQSPQLLCPCMQCSGDATVPCNSDEECASQEGSCTSARTKRCTTDEQCNNFNGGTCNSIKRCQFATSISCTTNSDCSNLSVGPCLPSTCSVKGVGSAGEFPLPNNCIDQACTDLGGGFGECSIGPDQLYCDAVVKANGVGILACTADADCAADVIGIDAGNCTLSERAKCFLDPITATGDADPETPIGVSTFCIPPTSNAGINIVAGLPGPGRITNQATATTFCASDHNVEYQPGVGGCPAE